MMPGIVSRVAFSGGKREASDDEAEHYDFPAFFQKGVRGVYLSLIPILFFRLSIIFSLINRVDQ